MRLINLVLLAICAASCFSSNPISFTAEAVGEKIIGNAVASNIAPLHDKIDKLAEIQKNQSGSIRLLMESFTSDREELRTFRNIIYESNRESARMHNRWEKYIKAHDKRIAIIEKGEK